MSEVHFMIKLVDRESGDVAYVSLSEGCDEARFHISSRMYAWRFVTKAEAVKACKDDRRISEWTRFDYVAKIVKVTVKITKWTCDCTQFKTKEGDDGLPRCVHCGRH